jgi:hypothetical protein
MGSSCVGLSANHSLQDTNAGLLLEYRIISQRQSYFLGVPFPRGKLRFPQSEADVF